MQRAGLDKDNAEDLFETLSELKGGALKVAQIMSMDKNMLLPLQRNLQWLNTMHLHYLIP